MVWLLRDSGCKEAMEAALTSLGHRGLSELVKNNKVPSFTKWRWEALGVCLDVVSLFFESLRSHFNLAWFAAASDQKRVREAAEAFQSARWGRQ